MRILFLLFLPTFALGTLCPDEETAVNSCEAANSAACNRDDNSGRVCRPDISGASTDVTPADVDPSYNCDVAKVTYCASAGCCDGMCTTQYRALFQCTATKQYGCVTFSCIAPTPLPNPAPVSNPTPAPTPAPVQATAPTGGGGCFSATSTVQVLGKGPVQMQDLQVGDQVLTGSPGNYKYQQVYAFGHLNKEALGNFYAIHIKGSKAPLEMTGEHLVYLAEKANPFRADSLLVGDVLMSIHGPAEIASIDIVKKQGLYNPLTADGHLIVDYLAVSTYIALQDTNAEHFQVVFNKQGSNNINLMSHEKFVHLYLVPFRMLCMGISSQLCQVHDAEGISLYISFGMQLVHWIGEHNVLVQLFFLLVTLPIYVAFWAMENLVGSSVAPLAFLAVVLLANKVPTLIFRKHKVA